MGAPAACYQSMVGVLHSVGFRDGPRGELLRELADKAPSQRAPRTKIEQPADFCFRLQPRLFLLNHAFAEKRPFPLPRYLLNAQKLGRPLILRIIVLLVPYGRPHGLPRGILLVSVGSTEYRFFVEPLRHYL